MTLMGCVYGQQIFYYLAHMAYWQMFFLLKSNSALAFLVALKFVLLRLHSGTLVMDQRGDLYVDGLRLGLHSSNDSTSVLSIDRSRYPTRRPLHYRLSCFRRQTRVCLQNLKTTRFGEWSVK